MMNAGGSDLYALIFGKNRKLGIKELEYFSKRFQIKIKPVISSEDAIIFKSENKIEQLFDYLGSFLKLVKIVSDDEDSFLKSIEYKRKFAVSIYPGNWIEWKSFAMRIKKNFQRIGSSKFFRGRYPYTMPSELSLQKLPEFVKIRINEKVFYGVTVKFVDPFFYKRLDVDRPHQRPIYSIPLRLVKAMLNLSLARESILDPFCGIGTILQEAILQGLKAYGSDKDKVILRKAKENLDWVIREFNASGYYILRNCDARDIDKCFREDIETIVTEPYLGEPLKRKPSNKEAVEMIRKLDSLYKSFLESAIETKVDRVVIVFPAFQTKQRTIVRRKREWIEEIGWKIKSRILDYEQRHRTIRDIFVLQR